ncbi:MAG: hypothetical protein UY21_C0009G0107 [Microgenomates group bacterium GW2011_GWA1_48_10]|nr:MAG: hypothetical protein UY21_C0009G0107 [Microgenomates group bacterium GW2011_GWA1_48_10]
MRNPDEELKVYRDFFTNIAVGLFLGGITAPAISTGFQFEKLLQSGILLLGSLCSLLAAVYFTKKQK